MTAYYNEIDPSAAQWLRNLIAADLIPAGDVDTRSIEDVRPSDLRGYRQCHFFAGIGGWAHALALAGWPADQPVWTGSCPCQPFSSAGAGAGFADERHLWPAWFHLIAQCRPERVFGEQVAAAVGHDWLDLVSADMEGQGYRVGAAVLGAHSIGAPHIRHRLWFVADAEGERRREARTGGGRPKKWAGDGGESGWLSDPVRIGQPGQGWVERPCDSEAGSDWQEHRAFDAGGGYWSRAVAVPCADGKARILEPGIEPLAHGLQDCLVRVRSIEDAGLREIDSYGQQNKRDASQVLRELRERLSERKGWEKESVGVLQQLHEAEVLLDFLLCLEAARDKPANRIGFEKASAEVRRRIVLGVRSWRELGCPSRQRESDGQQQQQPSDALLSLSLVLARHAQAHREAARIANASSNRVVRLRGYGNSICPQVAAAFIKSYVEVVNANQG